MKRAALLLLSLLPAVTAMAANAEVKTILDRYQAIRPGAGDLGMYRLHWEDSLDSALPRASKEGRPVCLIIIHAKYGNISSGHC